MKLLCAAALLALVAFAAADDQFYQPQNYDQYNQNYYQQQQPGGYRPRPSIIDRISSLFQSNRRQGFPAVGGIFGAVVAVVAVVVFISVVAAVIANSNSSGRGLDTDEWEVDHSVWMDQLQKDFEDSWSTQ